MPGQTDIPPVPPRFLPTIYHLVGVASARGLSTATARTIHGWRDRGIISSEPTRYATHYCYPLAAIGEVDCQVRWGRRKMSPELLTFARYVEAGTVLSDEALSACRRLLEATQADAAGMGLTERREVVAQEEEQRAARARGANAMVPRAVGMSQDERDAAFMYLFGVLLGVDDEDSPDGRFQCERLIGARSGHGRAGRDPASSSRQRTSGVWTSTSSTPRSGTPARKPPSSPDGRSSCSPCGTRRSCPRSPARSPPQNSRS
ncbi:MAG: hypothetical protein ACLP50_36485 [Solirubrobacteraceae bacterium]